MSTHALIGVGKGFKRTLDNGELNAAVQLRFVLTSTFTIAAVPEQSQLHPENTESAAAAVGCQFFVSFPGTQNQ